MSTSTPTFRPSSIRTSSQSPSRSSSPSPLSSSSAAPDFQPPPRASTTPSRLPKSQQRPLSMASFKSGIYDGETDSSRRKKKPKAPVETHIFVRPPPSSKGVMNVQCQLVAHPTGSARTASESVNGTRGHRSPSSASTAAPVFTASPHQSTSSLIDPSLEPESSSPGEEQRGGLEVVEDEKSGRRLSRSPSVMSTASATSQGTVASTASGGAAKRITPLWNLNHHTVMTTFISDAGTDAKLVKYLKRGIAVHRLGFLEPYEHWPSVIHTPSSAHPSPAPSFSPLPSSDLVVGRQSLDQVFSRQSTLSSTSTEPLTSEVTGPKKLFGRFFGGKKKEGGGGSISDFSFFKPSGGSLFATKENLHPLSPSPSGSSALSITPTASPSKSFAALNASPRPSSEGPPSVCVNQVETIHGPLPYLGHPTLGTQPIVRPLPANEKSPGSRPAAYIWVVTKWTAGDDGWTFAGLSDALNIMGGTPNPSGLGCRFEWIRGRTASKRPNPQRRASGNGSVLAGGAGGFIKANSNGLQPGSGLPPASLSKTSLSLSTPGGSPEATHRASFESRNGANETEPQHETTDADEECDPEDCEVPWLCYVVRTPAQGPSERSLIGTLSPAPHHPKVLAQLKTPYPLHPFPLPGLKEMPFLSPEQLKDVLCATAMYLLIREQWGGIGKKKDATRR